MPDGGYVAFDVGSGGVEASASIVARMQGCRDIFESTKSYHAVDLAAALATRFAKAVIKVRFPTKPAMH